jgi:predicted ArsR family transcriptional regulator
LQFDKRVKELARIRHEEGYIAESKKHPKNYGMHVLLEYNCPHIVRSIGWHVPLKMNYLKNIWGPM